MGINGLDIRYATAYAAEPRYFTRIRAVVQLQPLWRRLHLLGAHFEVAIKSTCSGGNTIPDHGPSLGTLKTFPNPLEAVNRTVIYMDLASAKS